MGHWVEDPNSIRCIGSKIVTKKRRVENTLKRRCVSKLICQNKRHEPIKEIDLLPKVEDCLHYYLVPHKFWDNFEENVFDTGWFDFSGEFHTKEEFVAHVNNWIATKCDLAVDKHKFLMYLYQKIIEHYDFSFLD